jgi:hypothetical protein
VRPLNSEMKPCPCQLAASLCRASPGYCLAACAASPVRRLHLLPVIPTLQRHSLHNQSGRYQVCAARRCLPVFC